MTQDLLERAITAMEKNANVNQQLAKLTEHMAANLDKLNDTFALHDRCIITETKEMNETVNAIRSELMRWLKWLAVALFVAIGGGTVIDKVIDLMK